MHEGTGTYWRDWCCVGSLAWSEHYEWVGGMRTGEVLHDERGYGIATCNLTVEWTIYCFFPPYEILHGADRTLSMSCVGPYPFHVFSCVFHGDIGFFEL